MDLLLEAAVRGTVVDAEGDPVRGAEAPGETVASSPVACQLASRRAASGRARWASPSACARPTASGTASATNAAWAAGCPLMAVVAQLARPDLPDIRLCRHPPRAELRPAHHPLAGRPPLPRCFAKSGRVAPAARWDGDTLVVVTAGFNGAWTIQSTAPNARYVEPPRRSRPPALRVHGRTTPSRSPGPGLRERMPRRQLQHAPHRPVAPALRTPLGGDGPAARASYL